MKSVMIGLRFKVDIYEAIKAKAGGQSIADYIKKIITESVNNPKKVLTPVIKVPINNELEGRLRSLGLKMEGKKIVGVNKLDGNPF